MPVSTSLVDHVTEWITAQARAGTDDVARLLSVAPESPEAASVCDVVSSLTLSGLSVLGRERAPMWWDLRVRSAAGVTGHVYVCQKGDDVLTGIRAVADTVPSTTDAEQLLELLTRVGGVASVTTDGVCSQTDLGEDRPAVASLVKVFPLATVLELVDHDDLCLDSTVVVTEPDLSYLGSRLGPQHVGRGVTIRSLCRNVALHSCNTSSDLLMRIAGVSRVTAIAQDCGAALSGPMTATRAWIEAAWDRQGDNLAEEDYWCRDARLRGEAWARPRHQDGLDYHLPLSSVLEAMRRIARARWNPWSGAAPALGEQRLFKGGNAPGVMAGAWYGSDGIGLAFAVNSPSPIGLLEEIRIYDLTHAFHDDVVRHYGKATLS